MSLNSGTGAWVVLGTDDKTKWMANLCALNDLSPAVYRKYRSEFLRMVASTSKEFSTSQHSEIDHSNRI